MTEIRNDIGNPPSLDSNIRNGHNPGTPCYDARAVDSFVPARRYREEGLLCATNRCLCSCHQRVAQSWGYLHFLHTQSSSIRSPCNRASCKTRSLKAMAAVDLSWLKLRYAIITSLEILWGLGGFSIKPSMEVKRVVAPGSRGFEISNKFRNGHYSAEEAAEAFHQAFQQGQASLMDVTPDGWSLTQSMMELTSLEAAQRSCRDVTYLLKTIAGHSGVMECLQALFKFCETAFEFGGIDPFDILNELGILYDMADEDISLFHHIIYGPEDPFGIKWLRKWLRKCPGFADVPRLIQEILLSDTEASHHTMTASGPPRNETFLGLSALHWASHSESWTRRLLEMGYDVSALDRRGRSPLIYAAVYGLLGVCLALLGAGVDPNSSQPPDHGVEWNFLRYAMYHGHLHIVFGSIEFFRRDSVGMFETAQTLLDQALRLSCRYLNFSGSWIPYYVYDRPDRAATVQKLLELGANPNAFQNNGENLLHQSWASETVCASLILDAGTKQLDVGSTTGETPAMRAAYEANAPLLQLYLDKGAQLQRRDNRGRNLVHYVIRLYHRDLSWLYPNDLWWRYVTLKTVLSYDIDAHAGDHCRCTCSLDGCSPSTMLMKQLFGGFQAGFRPSGLVLSIEWLLLLQELVSYNATQRGLADLTRFLWFQMSGLTHVCCRPKVSGMSWWQESPIDEEDISEILNEEEELIFTLEDDLEKLRSPLDQRDPAETWADTIVDFAKSRKDDAQSSDAAKTSFRHGLLHYESETRDLLGAVYEDDATFLVRFEHRQALVRRCLDRLSAT